LKRLIHPIRLLSLTLACAAILAACNNEPEPVGVELLPGTDLAGVRTYYSDSTASWQSSGTFLHPITASSTVSLSVGSADGYNAYTLVRWFSLPDSIGTGGRIVSATVSLHPNGGHIGDAGSPLSFHVREITKFWSSFTFTSDSLKNLQETLEPGEKGRFSGVVDTASIVVDLDSALVRKWLTLINTQKYYDIRGILLEPEGEGMLHAFDSFTGSKPPVLTIVMEQNGKLDTIHGAAPENTYVATGPAVQPGTMMAVHGGLAHRGFLRFDVSGVPTGCIVNHASVTLTRDPSRTIVQYRGIDSVYAYFALDSTTHTFGTALLLGRGSSANPDEFVLQGSLLTQAVQSWSLGKPNNGFILVKAGETSDLDQIAFYGADAPVGLRPRIVITYTLKP
jgi:hypothetical protein